MTGPTPKPEEPKPEVKALSHGPGIVRAAVLAISACLAFAIFAFALNRVLPSPHSHADYLIIGTLATLAALITVFAGLVMGRGKR